MTTTRTWLRSAKRMLPIAAANGTTVLRQTAHIRTGVRLSKPNIIHVMINNACNLRCQYCDIWKNNGEGDLPTDVWMRTFDELLSWTKHPKLNISGGEPFLRKDIYDILRFCVKKGAVTGVVTNGWAITPKMAPRVAELGLSNVNISLDSLDPEVCDFMRGRPGHTERTVLTTTRILEEIRRQGVNTKVYLKVVVSGANVHSLIPLVRFAEEHGVTGVTFQPLEAVFSRHVDYGDQWFANTPLWPKDPEPLADVAAQLVELKKQGAPINNPISHIESWGSYFRDPISGVKGQIGGDDLEGEDPVPCRVGHSHLYINANGTFKLCWSFDNIGSIVTDSIPEKWKSDFAEQQRDEIAGCTEPCTKTCQLDRGMGETVRTFLTLMKPNRAPRSEANPTHGVQRPRPVTDLEEQRGGPVIAAHVPDPRAAREEVAYANLHVAEPAVHREVAPAVIHDH